MKKTDNYAGNQIRLFLGELKNGTHVNKMKAVQHFQTYIKTYQPNVSDDNVDYLFTGSIDGTTNLGLLHWCGVDSEKHDGQLKRICAPLISLLRWLVTFPDDTIYYERFIHLSKDELVKVNFPKHILKTETKGTINISTNQRSGSSEDAFELLCILINDHRNLEDEVDPIDIMFLLKGSQQCQEKFEEWLQKANLEHMTEALQQLKNPATAQAARERITRPREWSEVTFKGIPLQEGEDVEETEADEEVDELPPVPDPLGLSNLDLRQTQDLYSSGLLQRSSIYARRNTAALLSYDPTTGMVSSAGGANSNASVRTRSRSTLDPNASFDDDEDDDDDEVRGALYGSNEKRSIASVIPSEKTFSVPLFLSLVHGATDYSQMQTGLEHLKEHLVQQSRRRENLVRNHFGLFVQCADGLEWLKAYRKGVYKSNEHLRGRASRKFSQTDSLSPERSGSTRSVIDKGMEKLNQAQATLDIAKKEAKSTLAPILERMKNAREIKSAEKVLRGMSTLLEYPHQMKKLIEKNEYNEAIAIYKRILLIPNNSSLKIIPKIKAAADSVMTDFRKLCYQMILTPNINYSIILKHANYILELDGVTTYLEILRLSFLRQLFYFLDLLKTSKERFFNDCVESYHKGQEINIISNNSLLAKGESDTVGLTIRKFISDMKAKRRNSSILVNNSSNLNNLGGAGSYPMSSKKRTSFSDQYNTSNNNGIPPPPPTGSPSYRSGRGSFSSENGNRLTFINLNHNNYNDDSYTETNNDVFSESHRYSDSLLDTEDDWISQASPSKKFSGFQMIPELDIMNNPSEDKSPTNRMLSGSFDETLPNNNSNNIQEDYSEIFCNILRKLFAENLIELISKWFPCLFRIAFEIIYQQNKLNAGNLLTNASSSSTNAVTTTTTTTTSVNNFPAPLNRQASTKTTGGGTSSSNSSSLMSANRLLAIALNLASDFLQQSVNGFKENFVQTSHFSNDLLNAFQELEHSWIMNIESPYGFKLPSNSMNIHQDDSINASRFHDIVVTSIFQNSISHSQLRDIFDESFIMFQAIETTMKTALSSLNSLYTSLNNSTASAGVGGGAAASLLSSAADNNLPFSKYLFSPSTNTVPSVKQQPPPLPFMTNTISATNTKILREITEMDFNSPSSPFYEPMRTLYLLSQEGVATLAQLILDKLLDKCCLITDRMFMEVSNNQSNPNEDNANNNNNYHDGFAEAASISFRKNNRSVAATTTASNTNNSSGGDNNNGNHNNNKEETGGLTVEDAVKELEELINRGLIALKKYIKRPEWVASIVHENIFKKILSSFAEGLKRKSLSIEHGKLSNNNSSKDQVNLGSASGPTRRNRKKSNAIPMAGGGGNRASFHQNALILQSLEEEFKVMDFGWERNDLTDISNNRPTAWIDFLKGIIRYRCYTTPLILKQVAKVFPLEAANTNGMGCLFNPSASISIPGAPIGSPSMPGNALNNNLGANANGTAAGGGGGGGGGTSLLNRLFAFEAVPADPITPAAKDNQRSDSITQSNAGSRKATGGLFDAVDDTDDSMKAVNDSNTNNSNASPAAGGNNTEKSMYDRIVQSIKENSKLYPDLLTSSGSLIFQNMKDMISLEMESMKKLIHYRIYSLKTILLSAYAFLVHSELTSSSAATSSSAMSLMDISASSLPSHLSKIILALAEEKKFLNQCFHQVTIEHGGNKHEYYSTSTLAQQHHYGGGNGSNQKGILKKGKKDDHHHHLSEDSDNENGNNPSNAQEMDDFLLTITSSPGRLTNRKPSFLSTYGKPLHGSQHSNHHNHGQSYATYLFEELCKGTLDCYEEILKKLLTGQLFDNNPMKMGSTNNMVTSSRNTNTIAYRTLHQCYEEMEFFKGLFRPILLNTTFFSKYVFSSSELSVINREKSPVSKEDLIKSGTSLIILIQSMANTNNNNMTSIAH